MTPWLPAVPDRVICWLVTAAAVLSAARLVAFMVRP